MTTIEATTGDRPEVLDQLLTPDGESVLASWELTPTNLGNLAVYTEFSPEVDKILGFRLSTDYDRAQAFYSHRSVAIRSRSFTKNKRFGGLARNLGFSYSEGEHDSDFLRRATLPTAEYVNNVLDSSRYFDDGMRFYEPNTDSGRAPGTEYISKLAEGLAPLPSPTKHSYDHDVAGHALGYILLTKQQVTDIRSHAKILRQKNQDKNDGKLEYGSPESKFADVIDEISGYLATPLVVGERRYSGRRLKITRLSGAIATGEYFYFTSQAPLARGILPAIATFVNVRRKVKFSST